MTKEVIAFLIGWVLGIPIYQFFLKTYVDKWLDKKYPL